MSLRKLLISTLLFLPAYSAVFDHGAPAAFAATLDVSITGAGTVKSQVTSGGIDCNAVSCSASYAAGDVVVLQAAPSSGGNYFTGWGGACSGVQTSSCTVLMGVDNQTVSATFSTTAPTPTTWAQSYHPNPIINNGGYGVTYQFNVMAATSDGGSIGSGTGGGGFVAKLNADNSIAWQKSFSASNGEIFAIQESADKGFIVAGRYSAPGYSGPYTSWFMKLDSLGNKQWSYGYHDTNQPDTNNYRSETINAIRQTLDGGYIAAGEVAIGSYPPYTYTTVLGLLVKLNPDGSIAWHKTLGQTGFDQRLNSIEQTPDGGYIAAGSAKDCGFNSCFGVTSAWLVKLDATGTVTWENSYALTLGEGHSTVIKAIRPTRDGGFVAAGWAQLGTGDADGLLLKINDLGVMERETYFGLSGATDEMFTSVSQTFDGGYIVAGSTSLNSYDGLVVKFDGSGSATWHNTYGSSKTDLLYSIEQTLDGGYLTGGSSTSFAPSFPSGSTDPWLLKLDASGSVADCGTNVISAPTVATSTGLTLMPGGMSSVSDQLVLNPVAGTIGSANASLAPYGVCVSRISISPASADFGLTHVAASITSPATFTIYNDGMNALSLTGKTFTGSGAAQFALSNDTCASGVVAPGGSCTVDVTFNNAVGGEFAAALTVDSNAFNTPAKSADVTGANGYDLTVAISFPDGAVSTDVTRGSYIDCAYSIGGICTALFPGNTPIVLHQTPAAGSMFSGWDYPSCVDGSPCAVTLSGDTTVNAYFGSSGGYGINPLYGSFPLAGGVGSITVGAYDGAQWTAGSELPWVAITAGGIGGSTGGTVDYSVAAGMNLRGDITVAGNTFNVLRTGFEGGLDKGFRSLATSFGYNAELASSLSSPDQFFVKAATQQANGKILVTGYKMPMVTGFNDIFVARYNTDGSVDTTFGTAGLAVYHGGFGDSTGNAIAYQVDSTNGDKIIVAGSRKNSGGSDEVVLLRFDAAGALDPSFNSTGVASFSSGTTTTDEIFSDQGNAVTFDSVSGSILVAGNQQYTNYLTSTNLYSALLLRFDKNGIPDTGFNASGAASFNFGSGSSFDAVALDANGKIVAAGTAGSALLLARVAGDGSALDSGFGTAGKVSFTLDGGPSALARSVALQSDGKIVVAGTGQNSAYDYQSLVLRFNDNGTLDAGFNGSGVVAYGGGNYAYSVALQADGGIVMAGTTPGQYGDDVLVRRYQQDGSPDLTFGSGGMVVFNGPGNSADSVSSVLIAPNGKIMVAGSTFKNGNSDAQIIALNSGSPVITITPVSPVDFGNVMVSLNQAITVTISNTGGSPLNVADIVLSGGADFSLELAFDAVKTCNVTNPVLNAGDYCIASVRFAPTATGAQSATLTVTSNDIASPTVIHVFNGTGTPDVVPPSDFGQLIANGGNGHVALSWSAAYDSSGIAGYKLVYAATDTLAANCSNGTLIYNGSNLAYTHFDLTANSTYYYRVCAVDASANSNISTGLAASAMATGASVTWTGAMGDGLWSTAGNWTPSTVPTSGDDVLIDGSGTVTLDIGATINSLVLGGAGTPTLAAGSSTISISTAARIKSGAVFSNNTTASVNGSFMSDGSITGTGELYLSNCPSAMFTTPFTMGKLTLYNSSAPIPSGSTLGALELFSVSNPTAVTLNDNLDTAITTLTTVNNNNIINGPGTLINSSGITLDLKGVTINAAVDNSGIINFYSSGTTINGALTTHPGSSLNITDMYYAYLFVANGFTNNGNITIRSTMSGYPSNLTVSNGTLTNAAGATITSLAGLGDSTINARLVNLGTFAANQNTTISKVSAAHGNGGTMSVASGVTLTITDGTFTNDVAGKLLGSGTLDLSSKLTFSNSGTVSGADLGTVGALAITGPLPDTATAFTNIDILGTAGAGTDYDQIAVSGAATIAGNLNVNLLSGFVPNIGDSFTIMTCGTSCSGTFAPSALPSPGSGKAWTIAYNATDVVLGVAAATGVVSPATLPDGTYGAAYSQAVSASGGTAPYSYSVVAGALPAGLTLSVSTGVIAGTPSSVASFTFTVRATDALGNTADQSYTVIIGQGAQAALTVTGLPSSAAYGQSGIVAATTGGSGSGAVSFSAGSSNACTVDPSTGVVAITSGSGTCSITAAKAGDTNYNAIISAAASIGTITPATQLTLTVTGLPSSATYGQIGIVAATTGGSGSGAVSFSAGSSTACTVDPSTGVVAITSGSGTCSITAAKAGDTNYNAIISAAASIGTITPATQLTLTVTGLPSSATYGQSGITVATTGGSSSGAISFSAGSSTACTVDPSTGVVAITSGSGTCTITASKAADTNYNAITSAAVSITTITPAAQTALTITGLPSSATFGQSGITAATTGGSGSGAVSFSTGSSTACTVDPSTGAVAITSGSGTCSITASKAADSNYSAITSAAASIATITPATQLTLSVTGLPSSATYGQSGITATTTGGSSSGAISFSAGSSTACTVDPSTGVVAITSGSGTCSITASKAADSNYSAITSTAASIATITPATQLTLSVTGLPSGAMYGQSGIIASTSGGSGSGPISFSAGSSTACTVDPATGVVVITSGSGSCSITATKAGDSNYSTISSTVNVTVSKAAASVTLSGLSQTYDGSLKVAGATTVPAGLSTLVTYDGSIAAPIAAGSYAVTVDISDTNYSGSASGTLTVAKATPVITWSNPADIVQGAALSSTQLNAAASVPGNFVYSPASGTVPVAGTHTLSVTFTPTDGANYAVQTATVSLTVTAPPVNQVTTGADGKTTAPVTVPVSGATVSLPSGTLLTDASGNPISGTLTVTASVMNSIGALPTNTATAQTSDGKILSLLGNSIDITISAGASTVKTINPPMIVNLPVDSTFALPGATVSYYSFDGTKWQLEGTAVVKSDNSVDMSVGHLSVWAVAVFAAAVDSTPPVISSFTIPATSSTLLVPVSSLVATDDVAVTGYFLSETATIPVATDPAWTAAIPTGFTFPTWGNHTLYAYAKDAAGNISSVMTAPVYIGSDPVVDGVVVPAAPTAPPKLEPQLPDAMKSLNFAMKVEIPTATEILHGDVAPLVNGVPQPDGKINLGDTIVILRRVVGL